MKPTTVELDRRVEEVKQALINAMTRYAIVQNVTTRYGVSVRTVDGYIAKAKKGLIADHEPDAPYLLAEHIAHRRDLRNRFRKAGDFNGELKAAQDEAKLMGLYPAVKQELTGANGQPVVIQMTWGDGDSADDNA